MTSLGSISADNERITYSTTVYGERTISRDLLALGRFDEPETHDAENVRMLLTSGETQGLTLDAPPLAADTILVTLADLAAQANYAIFVRDSLQLANDELTAIAADAVACAALVDDLTTESIEANNRSNAILSTLRTAFGAAPGTGN